MYMFVHVTKVSLVFCICGAVLLRLITPVLGRKQMISCVELQFVGDENFRLQKKKM